MAKFELCNTKPHKYSTIDFILYVYIVAAQMYDSLGYIRNVAHAGGSFALPCESVIYKAKELLNIIKST